MYSCFNQLVRSDFELFKSLQNNLVSDLLLKNWFYGIWEMGEIRKS